MGKYECLDNMVRTYVPTVEEKPHLFHHYPPKAVADKDDRASPFLWRSALPIKSIEKINRKILNLSNRLAECHD